MNNSLHISATPLTPEIYFNTERNMLDISGRSIPMNPEKFWSSVMSWFIRNSFKNQEMIISLNFDYLNSGSQKFLVRLLRLLKESADKGLLPERTIIWKYPNYDQDMLEIGQDLEFVSGINFVYEEIKVDIWEAA